MDQRPPRIDIRFVFTLSSHDDVPATEGGRYDYPPETRMLAKVLLLKNSSFRNVCDQAHFGTGIDVGAAVSRRDAVFWSGRAACYFIVSRVG